jgi:uncharacterized protein
MNNTHIITATGAEYHLIGHGLRPVKLEDIAHQLAQINRFTGACSRPYSVAEHSLFVYELSVHAGASTVVQLAALLHDAHEAYTSDLSSPAKQAVDSVGWPNHGGAWHTFEYCHQQHVRNHFGLRTTFVHATYAIREWDLIALATERRDLTAWQRGNYKPWPVLRDGTDTEVKPVEDINLASEDRARKDWNHWRIQFLNTFNMLQEQINKQQAQPLPAFDERFALVGEP